MCHTCYRSKHNIISFQIWREYDTDGSGYIEADELKVIIIIIFQYHLNYYILVDLETYDKYDLI